MSPRLAFAIEAVVRAGRSTLAHFQTGVEVECKADETPVTIADRDAERMLRHLIERQYPGEGVLGEEEGESGPSDDRWVIDPIDGTKSFISGVPLYATLLSFERKGEAELGVCYFPALDELLYAELGKGAYWNGRQCRVSSRESLKGAIITSSGHLGIAKRGLMDGYTAIAEAALATRTWCDAYGHALVATGRVDAMIDATVQRWDISPLSVIVREAGGAFTDLEGKCPLSDSAVSTNGVIHDAMLRALRGGR
jgi:histidinol-phosphatase